MLVPSGLTVNTLNWLAPPTCSQRENMMSPFGRTTGLRSWLWLNEICVTLPPFASIVCKLNVVWPSYSSDAR